MCKLLTKVSKYMGVIFLFFDREKSHIFFHWEWVNLPDPVIQVDKPLNIHKWYFIDVNNYYF